jgi:hypothetical protein
VKPAKPPVAPADEPPAAGDAGEDPFADDAAAPADDAEMPAGDDPFAE